MKSIIKSFKYGNNEVKIETGVIARQGRERSAVIIWRYLVLVTVEVEKAR